MGRPDHPDDDHKEKVDDYWGWRQPQINEAERRDHAEFTRWELDAGRGLSGNGRSLSDVTPIKSEASIVADINQYWQDALQWVERCPGLPAELRNDWLRRLADLRDNSVFSTVSSPLFHPPTSLKKILAQNYEYELSGLRAEVERFRDRYLTDYANIWEPSRACEVQNDISMIGYMLSNLISALIRYQVRSEKI